jgi:hypothetical protein
MELKNVHNLNRRKFFLSFFHQEKDHDEELFINGFVLFKHWDGHFNCWTADLFTEESYQARDLFYHSK